MLTIPPIYESLNSQSMMPCSWASTMRGQRSVLHRMVAFSVDMRSLGSPWLFQVATSASSVSRVKGSRPFVIGIGTCRGGRCGLTHCSGRSGSLTNTCATGQIAARSSLGPGQKGCQHCLRQATLCTLATLQPLPCSSQE